MLAAVAVSAGVCEEVLYRGFLTHAASHAFPALAFAVMLAISAVACGLAHAYQGSPGCC